MSLLDTILDTETGFSPKCPVTLYNLENPVLGEELLEAIGAKSEDQYRLTATAISSYLASEGTKISASAIRNHRRSDCACI